jgi:DNA-directed RNA polymerase subunit M/transcription elongation factor TFIIS
MEPSMSICSRCGKILWAKKTPEGEETLISPGICADCKEKANLNKEEKQVETYPEIRKELVQEINSQVKSDDPKAERKRLEGIYGEVWSTQELSQDFTVQGFLAPFVSVTKKSSGKTGTLEFQHMPRFYFNFVEG